MQSIVWAILATSQTWPSENRLKLRRRWNFFLQPANKLHIRSVPELDEDEYLHFSCYYPTRIIHKLHTNITYILHQIHQSRCHFQHDTELASSCHKPVYCNTVNVLLSNINSLSFTVLFVGWVQICI